MCDTGGRRGSGAHPEAAGFQHALLSGALMGALIIVSGLQVAAVSRVLWKAGQATGAGAWWWAAAAMVLLLASITGWRAAWRGISWRYAGLCATVDGAADIPEIWIARCRPPGQAVRLRARVAASWRVADLLTVLRLSDPMGLAPPLLVVPAGMAASLRRALLRNTASRR